jgi:hypothetical protein
MSYNKQYLLKLAKDALTPPDKLREVYAKSIHILEKGGNIKKCLELRNVLTGNPNTPLDTLLELIKDKDNIAAFCQNPILDLLFLENQNIFSQLHGLYFDDFITSVFCTPKVVDMCLRMPYTQDPAFSHARFRVARRPDLFLSSYQILAKDRSRSVRKAIANNNSVPLNVVKELLTDGYYFVRKAAAARHSKGTQELRHKMRSSKPI